MTIGMPKTFSLIRCSLRMCSVCAAVSCMACGGADRDGFAVMRAREQQLQAADAELAVQMDRLILQVERRRITAASYSGR
jgi:hypothetical protein